MGDERDIIFYFILFFISYLPQFMMRYIKLSLRKFLLCFRLYTQRHKDIQRMVWQCQGVKSFRSYQIVCRALFYTCKDNSGSWGFEIFRFLGHNTASGVVAESNYTDGGWRRRRSVRSRHARQLCIACNLIYVCTLPEWEYINPDGHKYCAISFITEQRILL